MNNQALRSRRPATKLARLRRSQSQCWASVREPKNPKSYKSMDELREHLQQQRQGASFAGALNWLSEHAFGDVASKGRWSMALAYRWLVANFNSVFPPAYRPGPSDEELMRTLDVDEARITQMALLLVCTEGQAMRIIRRYPKAAKMDSQLLTQRLIGLKMALPECDVGLLLYRQPKLFLEGDQVATEETIKKSNKVLRAALEGADVTALIESDPGILFEDVASGVEGLLDLWPVGPDTMANSDPVELALAVRALSAKGPPKRM